MFKSIFDSFGVIPDIFRGKDPKEAVLDNVRNGAMVTGAIFGAPALAGVTGLGAASGGAQAAAPAIGGQAQAGLLGQVSEYAKPIGNIASAVGAAQGLLGQPEEMQAPMPMQQTGTGSQTLAMLAGQNQQDIAKQLQMAEIERLKRRQGGLL